MQRRLARALGAVLIVIAAAIPAGAQDKPRSGGELVFVVPSEPPSYDAHQEDTFGVIHPMAPHYSTLLRVDPTDKTGTKPVGDLAESWTVSKDGLTYTFKLRKGVKFHDGGEMTSKDVKASYDKIIKPPAGVKSLRKDMYDSVTSVEAPDSNTVVFKLKWPEFSLLLALASPWNWIYKADIIAKDPHWYETHVMGTGPFKFGEHVKGSHWVGKKNPDYWDKGKPYLDGYRAIFIRDPSAEVAAVRGERAMIQFRGFTPSERDQLVTALGNKITVQESPWNCSIGVTPNQQKKPFDDKRVRRALTLALDRWNGSKALSRIALVKDVAGIQVPGTPWATPPEELTRLAGYGHDMDLHWFLTTSPWNIGRHKDTMLDELYQKQSRAVDPEERKKYLRAFEKRLYDEEVDYILAFQWHRIIPHSSRVHGWTVTPSHYLNQQLDTVWLSE